MTTKALKGMVADVQNNSGYQEGVCVGGGCNLELSVAEVKLKTTGETAH
jgi:hypothetical protein